MGRAERTLRQVWAERFPDAAELASIELRPLPDATPEAGSRPQVVLHDALDRRYLFKVAPVDQLAAELLAFRVRSLGGPLHVPSARRTLELPGMAVCTGLVQPMVDVVSALERRPTEWSPEQREAMLIEHPWEWLLANFDTHVPPRHRLRVQPVLRAIVLARSPARPPLGDPLAPLFLRQPALFHQRFS